MQSTKCQSDPGSRATPGACQRHVDEGKPAVLQMHALRKRSMLAKENVRASKLADTLTAVEDKLADQELAHVVDACMHVLSGKWQGFEDVARMQCKMRFKLRCH